MSQRRNTYTALLFLAGLTAASVYLGLGLVPQSKGFQDATPSHAVQTGRIRTPLRERVEGEDPRLQRREAHPIRASLGLPIPSGEEAAQAVAQFTQDADPALNELLDREHTFIELYGGFQRLMGRQVVEDPDPQYTVVKLTDGLLAFADLESERTDMTVRAQEMVQFSRRIAKEYRIPFLYVQAPSKLDVAQLPDGVTDTADAEADQFLELLEAEKVSTLDLRPVFRQAAEEDPEGASSLFFLTDHHWTPQGAFLGYQTLCEELHRRYYLSIDEELTDPDSFERYTFEDVFLGSQGRRVGSLYTGLDDLEIWSPKFSTDFTYTVPIVGIEREGPFAVSLLFPERLADTGYYDTNPYTIYSGDDYLLSRALNHNNPKGMRILILRDSFGCALTPFLALASQEVMAIDPRNFNGNQDTMMDYIDWLEPDLVIVMNTTGSLKVDKLFPYLPTARADARAAKAAEREKERS